MRLSRAILEGLTILLRSFDPFVAHRRRDAEAPAQLPDVGPFNPGQRYELSSIRHPGPHFEWHRAASFRRSLCASWVSTMSPATCPPCLRYVQRTPALRSRASTIHRMTGPTWIPRLKAVGYILAPA